jgi:hypothetical protein
LIKFSHQESAKKIWIFIRFPKAFPMCMETLSSKTIETAAMRVFKGQSPKNSPAPQFHNSKQTYKRTQIFVRRSLLSLTTEKNVSI